MTFFEAYPEIKKDKVIRRCCREYLEAKEQCFVLLKLNDNQIYYKWVWASEGVWHKHPKIDYFDLEATDWEIVEE